MKRRERLAKKRVVRTGDDAAKQWTRTRGAHDWAVSLPRRQAAMRRVNEMVAYLFQTYGSDMPTVLALSNGPEQSKAAVGEASQ